jgi:hypothetical protein
MQALQPVLAETTHEVFRDDTPEERAARLEKPWDEETVA